MNWKKLIYINSKIQMGLNIEKFIWVGGGEETFQTGKGKVDAEEMKLVVLKI